MRDDVPRRRTSLPNWHQGVRFPHLALTRASRQGAERACHARSDGFDSRRPLYEPIFRRRTLIATQRSPVQLWVGSPGEAQRCAEPARSSWRIQAAAF